MERSQEQIKADELVEKYFSVLPTPDHDEYTDPLKTHKQRAVQCAILECEARIEENSGFREDLHELFFKKKMSFWEKVKSILSSYKS